MKRAWNNKRLPGAGTLAMLAWLACSGAGRMSAQAPGASAPLPTIQEDTLAARRTALRQAVGTLGANDVATLKGRVSGSASDDAMVELGYAYFNAGQRNDALDWWKQAATAGNSFGYVALAEHAAAPGEKRRDYMQAALLNDPDAEWQYALMLLNGEGGAKLPTLGAMTLVDAATHGDLPAMVQAGAAYLHLGTTTFSADPFPNDVDRARLFLDHASELGLKTGDLEGLRTRRDAYASGMLKDPTPNHNLSDANFVDYLKEFRPPAQPAVIAKAQQSVDPKSPAWVRAQEERVWLTNGQDKTLLLPLSNNDTQNLSVLYFTVSSELAELPTPRVFHDAASLALATKILHDSQAGLAKINAGGATWGLDPEQGATRQNAVRQTLEAGAALADAVDRGDRWVNPNGDPEKIVLDYLDGRGGLDKLLAVQSAHMIVQAHVSKKLNDDNQKDVRREYFLAEDGARLSNASLPNFGNDIDEVVIASTQSGWLLRANQSPVQWDQEQAPGKRDKAAPATFGRLQAPAAGDLDDPLLEWARARKANGSWGRLSYISRGMMTGQNYNVYELEVEPDNPNLPTYRAFITTDNYVLVQLSFSYPKDPETATTVNYNYREVGTLAGGVLYPTRCDVIYSSGASENDTVLAAQANPAMPADLFRLDKDDIKPLRDDLDAKAKLRHGGY